MAEVPPIKRISDRVPVRIRAEFISKKIVTATTVNVSRNGVFVIDNSPERMVNSVLRLRLYLPPLDEPVEIFGRIAWKGAASNITGVGIHFLNMESDARKKWVDFVQEIERLDASMPTTQPLNPVLAITGEQNTISPPTKAKSATSFMVRFKSLERFEQFIAGNVDTGEMFLKTPVLKPVGEKVQVVLVHPQSDKDFELSAEVSYLVEIATDENPKGMGLKFTNITDEIRASLLKFMNNS